ncbi:hypothetical protein NG895_00735 [Aeoliella sp. ICT_H6.2]|uniref:Uncharacterized protein n=1 Tax=Aeoliella straminimaris TaxID=2954799 RepID=A0A9X2F592_9BACT|nr:hypothetical protein [Aeoliella straminimaris]MCO6042420.1 hypothetical protein [Aeoliella straminimaris]
MKPDILNHVDRKFLEIKPLTEYGLQAGPVQLLMYSASLFPYGYFPGYEWIPSTNLIFVPKPAVFYNFGGLVLYTEKIQLQTRLAVLTSVVAVRELFRNPALLRFLNQGTLQPAFASARALARSAAAYSSARSQQSPAIIPIGGGIAIA